MLLNNRVVDRCILAGLISRVDVVADPSVGIDMLASPQEERWSR